MGSNRRLRQGGVVKWLYATPVGQGTPPARADEILRDEVNGVS
jgi:hypothetical protein